MDTYGTHTHQSFELEWDPHEMHRLRVITTVYPPALSVHDKVFNSGRESESVDVPPGDALLTEAVPDGPPAPGREADRPGDHSRDVFDADLAVTPDGGHDGVHRLALEPGVGHSQVLAPGNEGQGPEVHVEHHEEGVWDLV